MPNYYVFDTNTSPVNVQMTNTYQNPGIIAPPENNASNSGRLFSIFGSTSSLVVLGLTSATISILLSNPSGSGRTVYLSQINGSIGGSSLLSSLTGNMSIVKGGTLTTPTTLTPANNNLGNTTTSTSTTQSSTAVITGGTTVASFQLAPGPFAQHFRGSIIIPPGNAISATVSSSSSAIGLTMTSVLNFYWWEV
ncbi:hypothetical protein [Paenibacillus macquariensis]|uniref:Uncharacterized protein n=1 Tax=Paenibacillus macquariensis TaxID=948756 RepID=A0ABY1KBL6_9BACL|nr:hypothetical protein [Paenibacillus macquariensis]MEC0094293.1 hypothetical protein [Paenibacillus macquariensis]OAB25914.1 hypothetical protein PMSM_27620 [Paenibacillus macquariensis subsp. macquariensis]SIR55780.1 hypothetical protein SAMN05421578_11899 [Paenibacillus macquariensis]